MTDPFLAEIRMFAGNYAPYGWALCNGQLLPLSQNTALFALLGTTYGGDGRSTFALPNLMGATPMQQGQGPGLSQQYLGEQGGSATVTLNPQQLPVHTHSASALASPSGDTTSPVNAVWASARAARGLRNTYAAASDAADTPMAGLGPAGSGSPHNNLQPYLTVTFIIALQGIFPPRP